jgi:hypothetical protein
MKEVELMKKLILYLLVIFAIGVAPAYAVPVCQTGDISNAAACLDGVPNESNDSEALLNNYNYFDSNDWELISRFEVPDAGDEPVIEGDDIGLSVSPDGSWHSGSYSFDSNVWDRYEEIVIVLKDGGIFVSQEVGGYTNFWSAYLLEYGSSSGDWTYPEYANDIDKDLSHLSVYGRGTAPVPEPANMLVLGISLVGLAGASRKKLLKK